MPRIEVLPSPDALATAVATALLERLASAQAAGEEPQVGLTGGTVADLVHRELARLAPAYDVDFGRVVFWWGDERFVAGDSPDRNAGQARAAFLDPVGATQVHEIGSADDFATAESAAAVYQDALRARGTGAFTVLMLGMGPDGHVASLFPGHKALWVDDRLAVAVHDSPKPPPDRVTLTFPALNRSEAVWLLVTGEAKAPAVADALGHAPSAEIPAAGVRGTSETVWWLDETAASELSEDDVPGLAP